MNKVEINIWKRKFSLEVVHQRYPGEEVLASQEMAAEYFCSNTDIINSAKSAVEQYILKHKPGDVELTAIDNIFKYVMPKTIITLHEEKRVVAIMCDFKFDLEHGIAVVFENEKFIKVGPQDCIL